MFAFEVLLASTLYCVIYVKLPHVTIPQGSPCFHLLKMRTALHNMCQPCSGASEQHMVTIYYSIIHTFMIVALPILIPVCKIIMLSVVACVQLNTS